MLLQQYELYFQSVSKNKLEKIEHDDMQFRHTPIYTIKLEIEAPNLYVSRTRR